LVGVVHMGNGGKNSPGFAAGWITACVGWVAVSWVIPNTVVGALGVIGMMTGVLMRWERGHRHWSDPHGAMEVMAGGTAGGLCGGLITMSLGIGVNSGAMELMTASMVGMVGGTLGGWAAFR
jgi:hypothetical protein